MAAPWARVASTFEWGASVGITSVAAIPKWRAARATACAWFPEEYATTPRTRSASGIWKMKFEAPRILKDPPRCKFSHFKNASTPAAASKLRNVMTGVTLAMGRIRAAAAWMSPGRTCDGILRL